MPGTHGGKYEDDSVLGYSAVLSPRNRPTEAFWLFSVVARVSLCYLQFVVIQSKQIDVITLGCFFYLVNDIVSTAKVICGLYLWYLYLRYLKMLY
jgi:hypothetical protein